MDEQVRKVMPGIGLLNEKSLHASLKAWYAQQGDRFEVPVDGYVIDIVRDDLLLEIQTGNFSAIKQKLFSLVRAHRLRLIYPVAEQRWIVRLAKDGQTEEQRRKSPKRGRVEELFREMVSFPQLLAEPNFTLEVLLIREEQVRRYGGKRYWRSRGWVTEDRRLIEVSGRSLFEEPADWRMLLPPELDTFTVRELAQSLGMRVALGQQMVYCLRKTGVLELTGKSGRAYLYRRVGT